ncbi:MAG: hypothetical protein ABJZ55_22160 [Fuerstiella sp.]
MPSNRQAFFSRAALCVGILATSFLADANAQGLKVSTAVYNAGELDSNGREPIVSSSVSLIHAGKAYDYVEAVGEVVIYEPSENRFVLLNPARGLFTIIRFEELNRLLAARGPRIEEYLTELKQAGSKEFAKTEKNLRFQLNPEFKQTLDADSGTLRLNGPSWTYVAGTREWQDEDQVRKYIQYTDWTARLNYVLHPSGLFPEPRLALNKAVLELKDRIPVFVQLSLRPDATLVLRAEYQFTRGLADQERQLISDWNTAITSGQLKELPFRQYQEKTLASIR